jgi:5-hydroxyisourate hydrolase-like protein (transthyretin family)
VRPTSRRILPTLTVAAVLAAVVGCGDGAAPAPTPRTAERASRSTATAPAPSPAKPPAPARGHGRITCDVTRGGEPADARVTIVVPPPPAADAVGRLWFTDVLRSPDAPTDVPAEPNAPGRHIAGGLPAGTFSVVATAADGWRAAAFVRLDSDADRRVVALRLAAPAPSGTLRGRVIGPDGKPFRGFVSVRPVERDDHVSGYDEWHEPATDGTFSLAAPARDRVAVAALVPGELRVVGPTVSTPRTEEYVLDLSLGYDRIAVHVFDEESGRPIAGATAGASCGRLASVSSARTDADGRCALLLGAGERTLYVEAPGHPGVGDLTLGPDERAVEIPLRAGPVVRVHVVKAADGSPVAGVPVYVRNFGADGVGGDGPPVRSGPDGIATFSDLPPSDALVFAMGVGWFAEGLELGRVVGEASSINNRRPRRAPVTLPRSGTADFEVRVIPAATFAGVVLDHVGGPVAGAVVAARPTSSLAYLGSTEGADFGSFPALTTMSGDDGRFRLDGVFPSAHYSVVATADGQPGDAAKSVSGTTTADVVLQFEPPHFADVLVVDAATGAPLAGVRVACFRHAVQGEWASRDVVAEATTGAAGAARLGPLVAGAFEAGATAPGHVPCAAQTFDAAGGAAPRVTLRLAPSGRIRGRVSLPGGLALESGVATVVDDDRSGRRHGALWPEDPSFEGAIGPDGTFEIGGVATGAHTVRAAADSGGRHFEGQAQAQTGEAVVAIALDPAESAEDQPFPTPASFAVRVLGPDSNPVGSASILASWTENGLSQQTTFQVRRGAARIPLASRGTEVTVSGAQSLNEIALGAGTLRVRIPEQAADGLELRLPPGVTIAGRVNDDEGRPVAGVPVRAFERKSADQPFGWTRDAPLATAVTAGDGTFELRALDRTAYDVAAEAPFEFEPPDDRVAQGGDSGVAIQLVRGTPSVVVVVDPDGKPVDGARVEVAKTDPGIGDGVASAETGPDGRATLPALVRGRTLRLSVNSWGAGLEAWNGEWTPQPELVVHLKRVGVVSGRVVLADGSPAGAVSVWWRTVSADRRFDDWRRTIADPSGAFSLTGAATPSVELFAGDYDAYEGDHQFGPDLRVAPAVVGDLVTTAKTGASDVVLRLREDRIVRLRLEGLHGPMADGERPRLSWGDDWLSLRSVATADPAVVLFSGVAPGREYTVVARLPVQNLVGRLTGVRAGQSVAVTLEPGATLEGRVVLPDGADWDSLNASFTGGGFSVRYESGKDSHVLIPCLPRIEGELRVWTYPEVPPERPGYAATIRATPGTPVEVRVAKER